MKLQKISIHGHQVAYRMGGEGPALLLIHGMAGSASTWQDVMPALAEQATVIAPDLPGHGDSEKFRGDYSLGNYASGLRDLLTKLGHNRATILGQSLGGGVAMQFAYQYPERCERLVLVSSGGLGQEVHAGLRALALPGAQYVLALGCSAPVRTAGTMLSGLFQHLGFHAKPAVQEIWRSFESLGDAQTREAFVHTLRSVVDVAGQRVDARDRLYLAAAMPTLLIWGDHDRIIPVDHAYQAHDTMPGSRLEIFEGAGHYPHRDDPRRFVRVLRDFIQSSSPADLSHVDMQALLHSETA